MNYWQTCSKCGNRWQVVVEGAQKALFTRPTTWFPLSDELKSIGTVTCSKCGTEQSSSYRFFGFLTARGVTLVIIGILLVMLAAAFVLPRSW